MIEYCLGSNVGIDLSASANPERKFGETITFLDLAKIGIILTALNLLVYWLSLAVGA